MALILSLDATTSVCSVALHLDEKLIDCELNEEPRAAASQLGVMIKNLLDKAHISERDLSAIAVSSGPGSYTGLRIVTSTAKGLCFSLGAPLLAVNSLSVLTKQLIDKTDADLFCPMLDARRLEVYCALLNSQLKFITPIEAKILNEESFNQELGKSKITFFGDGSEKFRKMTNHKNAIFVRSIQPNATDLGYLAYERFVNKEFENMEAFEPYYLKDFVGKKMQS